MNQNLEKWREYTSGLSSPNNYIDWGWRYLVCAFLQRRVWLGPEHQACYPNIYPILVGNPGVGKGLVIKEVSGFLHHWKLKDAIKVNGETFKDPKDQVIADTVRESDLKRANEIESQPSNKQAGIQEALLVPIAADATTYEALVEAVANSFRRINYLDKTPEGKDQIKIYGHSSICFALPELSSLLRKRTEDTVRYLLGLYDCPDNYEYVTKTKGKDRVRRGCLNIIAGTTPGFMQSIFNDELVDEGFSSRAFFIYAERNRKYQFFIPQLTEAQLKIKLELLEHLRKLTTLYGNIRVSAETFKFLEEWWETYNKDYTQRANTSPKLIPYYARKQIHVMKIAISEWFSDHTDMEIPVEYFQHAINILGEEEKNMHLAIHMESSNPLSNLSKKILALIEIRDCDDSEIIAEMWDHGTTAQIKECLEFLLRVEKLKVYNKELYGREVVFYTIKK